MDVLLGHSDAWTTQLKSNALLITIVLFAVVVYIAATSGSYPRRGRPKVRNPIPFAKIVQANDSNKVRVCTIDSGGTLSGLNTIQLFVTIIGY